MGENYFQEFGAYILRVFLYPFNPGQRIFYLYVFSSLALAVGAYLHSQNFRTDRLAGNRFASSLFAYVFPRKVWGHPSAWVDVRYFLPHQLLRLWIYTDFLMLFVVGARNTSLATLRAATGAEVVFALPVDNGILIVAYALVSIVLVDFAGFYLHYLQHKIPVLWAFHKVHHSAEVLHPLSNYREHPVDNFAYAIANGITIGLVTGAFLFLFGARPLDLVVPILGINVFLFAFNFFGYNLRHSHIWIRWPGALAYLFGCPAHHQIHHSFKPHHRDRNFAFIFPVWDILFGTFYLPAEEEELDIGLGDGTEGAYSSYVAIYSLPFINLFRSYRDGQHREQDLN